MPSGATVGQAMRHPDVPRAGRENAKVAAGPESSPDIDQGQMPLPCSPSSPLAIICSRPAMCWPGDGGQGGGEGVCSRSCCPSTLGCRVQLPPPQTWMGELLRWSCVSKNTEFLGLRGWRP